MNIQFNDKRALVTASTGGIGFAIAQGLAEAGAQIV
ncbi:MAG: oxidoreductase, partial [Pseudomonas helleri]